MQHSNHANQRMNERNIDQASIDRAIALAKSSKHAGTVGVYVQRTNVYVVVDTTTNTVITAMYMHKHRIKRHGTALRAAKAHAQHNHTKFVAV